MTLQRAGWCNEPSHSLDCQCLLQRWRQHNEARRTRTPNTTHAHLPETRQ